MPAKAQEQGQEEESAFVRQIRERAQNAAQGQGEAEADAAGEETAQQEGAEIAPEDGQESAQEKALPPPARDRVMNDFPVVKLRSLDKVTARTMTFEAKVGSTVKFGGLYIKVQACRKAPPIEAPESASFLQIWEVTHEGEAQWVFSGWMFASSPGLSAMDHPIYDVWVLDCLKSAKEQPEIEQQELDGDDEGSQDGILKEDVVPSQPEMDEAQE